MAVQAIAGVSASNEAVVWTEYPSIAAIGIGQTLGSLYESLPIKILGFGPSLSHIFALLTAPIGVLLYAAQKLFGHRYILTNRNVHVRSSRGDRMISTIGLGDFDHIELVQNPGQVFYKAADIRFVGASGETLMKLAGVKDAGAFKNAIERTSESRRMVQASLKQIEARG
ncbi:MAG: PH domain-containing protein [Fuerstiella sp.]